MVRAEVGVDDGLVVHDRVGRALGHDLALGHDDDPVGDVPHHVHVVLDEEHGHALVAEALDVAEQRLRQGRVHAGHRLVEHDHAGSLIRARAISSSLRWPPERLPAKSSFFS